MTTFFAQLSRSTYPEIHISIYSAFRHSFIHSSLPHLCKWAEVCTLHFCDTPVLLFFSRSAAVSLPGPLVPFHDPVMTNLSLLRDGFVFYSIIPQSPGGALGQFNHSEIFLSCVCEAAQIITLPSLCLAFISVLGFSFMK